MVLFSRRINIRREQKIRSKRNTCFIENVIKRESYSPPPWRVAPLRKTKEKPRYGLAERKILSPFISMLFSFPVPHPHPPFPLPPETLLYFSCARSQHTGITTVLCLNLIQFGSRAHCDCKNICCTWSTVASCSVTEKNSYLSKSLSYG